MSVPPRRFYLQRDEDVSGISGTGKVASGCQWSDGAVVLHWNSEIPTTTVFQSIEDVENLHGHDGATRVVWIDDPRFLEHADELQWSNMEVGGKRLTWKEAYENVREAKKRSDRLAGILGDLDRCEHGRHQADNCSGCGDVNTGNAHLVNRIVGNDIRGNNYVVPDHTGDPDAWESAKIKK